MGKVIAGRTSFRPSRMPSDEKDRVLTIKPKIDERWKTLPDGTMVIEKIERDKGNIDHSAGEVRADSIQDHRRADYRHPVPVHLLLCRRPGVCVWLALTELMPTRIRSMGIGVAMLLNTGVQFLIALFFLPVVGNYGFSAMFFFWAGCTVIYFITAAFFMPETKGKTLEEIEDYFEGKRRGN